MTYFKTNIYTPEADKARTFPSHCNQAVTASVWAVQLSASSHEAF